MLWKISWPLPLEPNHGEVLLVDMPLIGSFRLALRQFGRCGGQLVIEIPMAKQPLTGRVDPAVGIRLVLFDKPSTDLHPALAIKSSLIIVAKR